MTKDDAIVVVVIVVVNDDGDKNVIISTGFLGKSSQFICLTWT